MRVDRCFGFVDLCGFTAFADRNGDGQAVLVLAELRAMLREIAARRGVRVVKWLGDGAMLSSTMVDAIIGLTVELTERMDRAVPSLPIRAGLASGPVVMFEGDDYIGHPVNVAARLCDQAEPRQILATVEVAGARPRWVGADAARSVAVRGLSDVVGTRSLFLRDGGEQGIVDPVCALRIARGHSVRVPDGSSFCSDACAGALLDTGEARLSVGEPDSVVFRPLASPVDLLPSEVAPP